MSDDRELIQAISDWSPEPLSKQCRLIYCAAPDKLSFFTIDLDIGHIIQLKKSPNKAPQAAEAYYNMKIGVFLTGHVKLLLKKKLNPKSGYETGEFHVRERRWRIIPALSEELVEIHRLEEKVVRFYQGLGQYQARSFGEKKAEKIIGALQKHHTIGGRDVYDRHDSRYFGGALAQISDSRANHDPNHELNGVHTRYVFGQLEFLDESNGPDVLKTFQEFPGTGEDFLKWLKHESELSLATGTSMKTKTIGIHFRFHDNLVQDIRKHL